MMFEAVHWVWNYWDGVRSVVADFGGAAHYFERRFDEDADAFADLYYLYPVDTEFMARARRKHEIFNAWAERHSRGEASPDSHPDRRWN